MTLDASDLYKNIFFKIIFKVTSLVNRFTDYGVGLKK